MMMAPDPLAVYEIPFGLWTEPVDPATGRRVPGQGTHRFYRFEQPVRLDRLDIPVRTPGPDGGGPRQVRVFAYDDDLSRPRTVFAGEVLPASPGEPCSITLPGVTARAASVLCDERYPVPVGFEQNHPTTYTVPFAILNGIQWFGAALEGPRPQPPYQPALQLGRLAPRAVSGQDVTVDPYEVRFSSPYLTVGFSLRRPQLMFLGWDALGQGQSGENALYRKVLNERSFNRPDLTGSAPGRPPGGNGPYLCDLLYDAPPFLWTGSVEVDGNMVRYHDLQVVPDYTVWAEFEVGVREIVVRLCQEVRRDLTLLDAAAWGFIWDGKAVPSLSTNAMPIRGTRRNGGVELRGAWNVSGQGMLNVVAQSDQDTVEMQVDTTGFLGRQGMAGLHLGTRHEPLGPVTLRAGTHETILRLDVRAIEPTTQPGAGALPDGLRRGWGSLFAFRPEGGGFSNNGFSINCQNCLYFQADLAPYTACPPDGPDVLELVRYSVALAVQGGPGYACQWEQAMDAAPSLAISIARVHQARPNRDWLEDLWPYLRRPLEHILAHIDDRGLYRSTFRPGDSGLYAWSSNAWDTISFGHYDAYSIALAYRALRGGVAVARDAGDADLSARCHAAADGLRRAFVPALLNPETGLIAGWRSADGHLHDHAYVYVNGLAICYGLVDDDVAHTILSTLERMRLEIGHDDFRYGICVNLKPVPRADYKAAVLGSPLRDDGFDTFGMFINGALMPTGAYFYLRALSMHGFDQTADRICDQLLDSFARRRFEGGLHSGTEYFTHDGSPTGYEGTLTHGYHVLLAIAQHLGLVQTLEPEWWPA